MQRVTIDMVQGICQNYDFICWHTHLCMTSMSSSSFYLFIIIIYNYDINVRKLRMMMEAFACPSTHALELK